MSKPTYTSKGSIFNLPTYTNYDAIQLACILDSLFHSFIIVFNFIKLLKLLSPDFDSLYKKIITMLVIIMKFHEEV